MTFLDHDEWGTWLWTPPGSTARRGGGPLQTFDHLNVKLITAGEWWTAIWNDSGRYDLYVDVIAPAAWRGDRVTMVDLDLDVIRTADGSVIIDDENEFATHQIQYGYPQAVIAKARTTADAVRRRIAGREEPFAEVGAARMRQAAQLVDSMVL